MKVSKTRGTWHLGTELPFSVTELKTLARASGGRPLNAVFGSAIAEFVGHGVKGVLRKLGGASLPVPQVRVPGLDRLGYELLLPIERI